MLKISKKNERLNKTTQKKLISNLLCWYTIGGTPVNLVFKILLFYFPEKLAFKVKQQNEIHYFEKYG